ncbi:MAG: phage shock protein E [Kiritimatiellia bacterium]|jgi:phage shock protein E
MFGMFGGNARICGQDARMKIAEGAVLVDVRSPGEFGGGHIEGALNIPVGALGGRLHELQVEREIVVYCASGMRSNSAARGLRAQGFTVHDLGSIRSW